MTLPAPPAGLPAGACLFLDFDGTLVEIAARPDRVVVPPWLPALLARLAERLDGRLALVSGRAAADIAAFVADGSAGVAAFPVAGSHGAEIRFPSGSTIRPERPAALDDARAELGLFASGRRGLLVEDKPLGVGLHYRMAPEQASACLAIAEILAARFGLHLQTGKMVVELRVGGTDKGAAIRALMDQPVMQGGLPVFAGDDDTDEPGFRVAAELGGAGILVGEASSPARARETAARYRLPGVSAVHAWLSAMAAAA